VDRESSTFIYTNEGLEKLQNAMLVVGLGGDLCCRILARAGVGKMTIVDGDVVDITNINRQPPALHSTVGQQTAVVGH
jgi:tRNA A37 threonylcarbamoyladenosine dehydratase